jgi:surfeit locus 1 family protein
MSRRSWLSSVSSKENPSSTDPPPNKGASSVGTALGKLFFGSLCLGTFSLGVWQANRYLEKQELIKKRSEDLVIPPVPFLDNATDNDASTKHASFRRYILPNDGTFDYRHEFLVGPRGPPPGVLGSVANPSNSAGGLSSAPQGYFVITPYLFHASSGGEPKVVLVNRGWIPRHMATSSSRTGSNARPPTASTAPQQVLWGRPAGLIRENPGRSLVVLQSRGEQPRFMVPEHDFGDRVQSGGVRIPKLFWFDLNTMRTLAGKALPTKSQDERTVLENEIPYVTLVHDERENDASVLEFPLSPTAEAISEFKVSPAVHVGYAMTWYSLSMSGMYMTRLLFKGKR